jgi:adenine-specific DNA-methyltransferase
MGKKSTTNTLKKIVFGGDVKDRTKNRLWWGRKGQNKVPAFKKFLTDVQQGIVPVTWWPHDEVGHTDEAKKEVLQVLEVLPGYITPKPTRLIERILQIATSPGDLILDSFAGSGTTGHAVLKMNQDPASRRRFIVVEIEPSIARDITAERLRRVINGYTYKTQRGKAKQEAGLGGGFRYCTLGPTLFDATGRIREEVTFDELARHVFFVETGTPLPKRANGKTPFLGVHNNVGVYMLYNGILKDKSPSSGNALTRSVLASLPPHHGPRVIYGTSCRISEQHLRQWGITFKQIPYAIKTE